MTDLRNKLSEAAKAISTSKNPMWECVKKAYVDHLNDIRREDLPEKLRIFYDSVKLRITTGETLCHINNEEASYIAEDILYMAHVINSGLKNSEKAEAIP
jgi:hypothetical protein